MYIINFYCVYHDSKHLFFLIVISKHLRLDKGTETGDMATIHAFIAQIHDDNDEAADTVHYGPSTSNRVRHTN